MPQRFYCFERKDGKVFVAGATQEKSCRTWSMAIITITNPCTKSIDSSCLLLSVTPSNLATATRHPLHGHASPSLYTTQNYPNVSAHALL